MPVPPPSTNIRRMLESRVKQMAAGKPVLAASLVSFELWQAGLPLHEGEKHHGHQLTYNMPQARPATVYVPVDLTEEVGDGSTNIADSNACSRKLLNWLWPWSAATHRSGNGDGPVVNLGKAQIPTTIRHFWPQFNRGWIAFPIAASPLVIYHKRFLIYWGLSLYLFQLAVADNWIST